MDIRELRIGNHVMFNGTRVGVIGIEVSNDEDVPEVITVHEDLDTGEFDIPCDPCELDPIPLTPELIKELGFFESEMVKDTPILHGIYVDPYMVKLAEESKGDFSKMPTDELFHLWHVKLPNKYGEWKIFQAKEKYMFPIFTNWRICIIT